MSIVGARPNMMKVAPLLAELRRQEEIEPVLVHTGQHYDYSMSQVFFDQLGVPPPDYNLGVGSGRTTRRRQRFCGSLANLSARPPRHGSGRRRR